MPIKERADRYTDIPAFLTALQTPAFFQAQPPSGPYASSPPLKTTVLASPTHTKEEWLNIGNEHYRARRYAEALSAYDQAIRLDPNYDYAHYNRGNILNDLLRYAEALSAYDQAIHLDPNYATAHNNRGTTLYNLKRYEEALSAYDNE